MNEAELLFTDILNCNRHSLYQDKDKFLDKPQSSFVSAALKRRMRGEPMQYILGKTEFMGLEFKLTPDVLIPRPETEIMVEKAIEIARSSELIAYSILDIGTGSGCIAVSLAKFIKDAKVTAVDISKAALGIAKQNALLNNVRVDFLESDLFSNQELRAACLSGRQASYELIISNPPYVPTAEIEELQAELKYEPRIALNGGKDGLDFHRRLAKEAHMYLKDGGFLIIEMGYNQKEDIKNIFQKSGNFEIIELIKDYNNIDRAVVAKKREGNG